MNAGSCFKSRPTAAEKVRAAFANYAGPLLLLALMVLVVLAIVREASAGYRWQWYRVPRYIGRFTENGFAPGPLLLGLGVTLKLAAASMGIAISAGLTAALCRLSASPPARLLGTSYVEIIRNTPLLLQLFMVYFAFAPLFGLSPFFSASLALGLFEGAYLAEIFRAGLISVPTDQWEAAFSLGFGTGGALRSVVLPQAFGKILPPFISQIVALIKDTALVSAIAVQDLTMRARDVISDTFMSFEIWLVTALVYLILTSSADVLAAFLDKKTTKAGE